MDATEMILTRLDAVERELGAAAAFRNHSKGQTSPHDSDIRDLHINLAAMVSRIERLESDLRTARKALGQRVDMVTLQAALEPIVTSLYQSETEVKAFAKSQVAGSVGAAHDAAAASRTVAVAQAQASIDLLIQHSRHFGR